MIHGRGGAARGGACVIFFPPNACHSRLVPPGGQWAHSPSLVHGGSACTPSGRQAVCAGVHTGLVCLLCQGSAWHADDAPPIVAEGRGCSRPQGVQWPIQTLTLLPKRQLALLPLPYPDADIDAFGAAPTVVPPSLVRWMPADQGLACGANATPMQLPAFLSEPKQKQGPVAAQTSRLAARSKMCPCVPVLHSNASL
jgi:hypothetical protein